jgi:hypothetical protein
MLITEEKILLIFVLIDLEFIDKTISLAVLRNLFYVFFSENIFNC